MTFAPSLFIVAYAALTILFATQLAVVRGRSFTNARAVTMALLVGLTVSVVAYRPIEGDTAVYYQYLQSLRGHSFASIFEVRQGDPLFAVFTWILGEISEDVATYWISVSLVVIVATYCGLKNVIGASGAVIVIVIYLQYPFFQAAITNVLRHGLSLAVLLLGYSYTYKSKLVSWVWLFVAILFHSAASIAVVVFAIYRIFVWMPGTDRRKWIILFGLYLFAILISLFGLNETLQIPLLSSLSLSDRQMIYFDGATSIEYRTGFRADFLFFSLLPIFTSLMCARENGKWSFTGADWWLGLYIALNIVYHAFSFLVFADRVAIFSWFLVPLIIYMQVQTCSMPMLRACIVLSAVVSTIPLLILINAKLVFNV